MRRIEKQPQAPAVLTDWIAWKQRGRQPLTYSNFKGYKHNGRDFRLILISEQFGLCAYTGLSLSITSLANTVSRYEPHTEHIKPSALCRAEVDGDPKALCCELDYHNMVATLDVISDLPNEYFGSRKKWDNYDAVNFISPTSTACESAFFYDENGGVTSASKEGNYTIELLDLGHETLVRERFGIISEYFPEDNFPDDEKLREIIEEVSIPNKEGSLPAFAFVIKQIALRYLPLAA